MQAKIEKLTKQITILETSVTENKTAAEIKEKAVSETKMSMKKVSEDKSFLDSCLKEACESIQRCLALLSDTTEEVCASNMIHESDTSVHCKTTLHCQQKCS